MSIKWAPARVETKLEGPGIATGLEHVAIPTHVFDRRYRCVDACLEQPH